MSDAAGAFVRVLFFAGARDAAGQAEATLEVPPEGASVASLAERLAQRFPALGARLRAVRFAVNNEYATPDALVRGGDELLVLPPVAGG